MACFRTFGLTSWNFRTMYIDPLSYMHEKMYPRHGIRDPVNERVVVKPHLSLFPGHTAGNIVGWCQCQQTPLAPFFRPGVSQCLCLPADGGPMFKNKEHKLSALPKDRVSPRWVVPQNRNPRRKYTSTRWLPRNKVSILEFIAAKSSEERKVERIAEAKERAIKRRHWQARTSSR